MTRDADVENGRWPEYAESNLGPDQSPIDPDEKAGQTQPSDEHAGAPPCIQRMFCLGIPAGRRDESLLHIGVYLKRAFPDNWNDRLYDIIREKCDPPLKVLEAVKIVGSLERKPYFYNCKAFQDICDQSTCLNRKFGIDESEQIYPDPVITRIQKIDSSPPVWILTVDGQPVRVPTRALKSHEAFRTAVMEQCNRLIGRMSKRAWEKLIANLLQTLEVVESPEEASTPDRIWGILKEWVTRQLKSATTMEDLVDGHPLFISEENLVVFTAKDLIEECRKAGLTRPYPLMLWRTLKENGAVRGRRSISGKLRAFWTLRMPIHDDNENKTWL